MLGDLTQGLRAAHSCMQLQAKLIFLHAVGVWMGSKSQRLVPKQSVRTLREQVTRTLEAYEFAEILPNAVIGPGGQLTVGRPFAGRRSIVILLPEDVGESGEARSTATGRSR